MPRTIATIDQANPLSISEIRGGSVKRIDRIGLPSLAQIMPSVCWSFFCSNVSTTRSTEPRCFSKSLTISLPMFPIHRNWSITLKRRTLHAHTYAAQQASCHKTKARQRAIVTDSPLIVTGAFQQAHVSQLQHLLAPTSGRGALVLVCISRESGLLIFAGI